MFATMPPLSAIRPGRSFNRNGRRPQDEPAGGSVRIGCCIVGPLLVWALGCMGGAAACGAAEPSAAKPSLQAEVATLIGQLDSERYEARQAAAERLRHLSSDPQAAPVLAGEISRVLVAPNTSFEIRRTLESFLPLLPAPPNLPPPEVTPAEIDHLVDQLEAADFGQRTSAQQRLEWLAGDPRSAGLVLVRTKERLSREDLDLDGRRWLDSVYKRARRAWLAADPKLWTLAPPDQTQVAEWIEQLVALAPRGVGANPWMQERAFWELRDALAWDDQVPRIRRALEAGLARAGLSPQAAERLRSLLELTRPAMVAECWGRVSPQLPTRLVGTQWLVVGVPSLGPGAERPSHFDRIDDQWAHCVSGQNLSPGDYPVGVAFPHPKQPGYLFQLVNLTSPRRLMAYEYVCETPKSARLAELSRRTFRWMMARRKPLSAAELSMLRLLDRVETSRFAAAFLEAVEDQPIPEAERAWLPDPAWPAGALGEDWALGRGRVGAPSRHGMLCEILAEQGTPEAVPALLRAIQAQRVLPPRPAAPYRLDALAVLAIAARHPSRESEAWLAALLARSEALVLAVPSPPEVAATAGAMLLQRHGQVPSEFGLEPAEDPYLSAVAVPGYRATSAEGLARLQQWWTARKERPDGT